MAGSLEKLVPVPDIALVEGLERRACRNHQMERELWNLPGISFSHISTKISRICIRCNTRRPAFFHGRFKVNRFFI